MSALVAETGILTATPARGMNDEPIAITFVGGEPGQDITFRARMVDDFGRAWASFATFKSSGTIDPSREAPVAGTYSGVDGMGMFWSMAPEDGRMVGGNIKNGVMPTTVTLTAEIDGETVASMDLERLYVADGVTRSEIRENGLVGNLFLPPGEGKVAGMLALTGSGGGFAENQAALLASHGFAAIALAYFNAEGLPDSLVDIPLEYFERALQWMASHPRVRQGRMGVMGASRGGELSLLLGSTFPAIAAVVAYVPSGVVWAGFGKGTDDMDPPPAAWTHGGKPLASVPRNRSGTEPPPTPSGEPLPLTPFFLKSLENEEGARAVEIAVEQTQAPILMISGEADAMWPSTLLADIACHRLESRGFSRPFAHLKYPDAGHGIRAPYVPTTVSAMEHPVDGGLYALGGTAEGNARANAESWRQVLSFLTAHLNA